jgi:hypothetical protein
LCRAYDRAAIKFRGLDADINFQLKDYEDDLKQVIFFFEKAGGLPRYIDKKNNKRFKSIQ